MYVRQNILMKAQKYTRYQVGCRGIEFFSVVKYQEKRRNKSIKEIFIENCKEHELKFIDPTA